MFKKNIIVDIVLFLVIVLLLLIAIPAISSILKQLVALQVIIVIGGAIALRYLVRKIRKKMK
ncbi:MAG: hypothetical protein V3S02_05365 [Dehalococcoidales bacterium]